MKFKLQKYFNKRIPLVIRCRSDLLYFQMQYEVAEEDGLRATHYLEVDKCKFCSKLQIGTKVKEYIMKFQESPDLSLNEFFEKTNMNVDEYDSARNEMVIQKSDASDKRDLDLNYIQCHIEYNIETKIYSFVLSWVHKKGKSYYLDFSKSIGEKGILLFDKVLEFDESVDAEELGEMVLEALERSKKIGALVNKERISSKKVELLNNFYVQMLVPRDKHFEDLEDNGVGELYQLYSYFPKENSESVADFYLGMAAELACNTSSEHVQKTWEEFYGVLEFFEMKEVDYGIFNLRVEMKNKKCHRISYLMQMDEDSLLECTMDLSQPGKRKKLDEKLSALFEEFAFSCKWQGKKI